MADKDVNIQETVCTSLSVTIQNTEPEKLAPLSVGILTTMTNVIDGYQGASLVSLYDCISCLAEVLGEHLRNEQVVNLLMPLLSKKWSVIQDNDKKLLPLFECFEMVIVSLGDVFIEPHILPIYERCLNILSGII